MKTNLLKILGNTEDESARAGTMINYFVLLSVINTTQEEILINNKKLTKAAFSHQV